MGKNIILLQNSYRVIYNRETKFVIGDLHGGTKIKVQH